MPAARPAFSSPVPGSLALALVLHAIGMSAAMWVGFSVAPVLDVAPDTFELRLASPRPTPPPAELFFAPPVGPELPAASAGGIGVPVPGDPARTAHPTEHL